MAYNTYYLRFESQEEAEQKLNQVNYVVTNEETGNTVYSVTDNVGDISIVGEIWDYKGDPIYDENEIIIGYTKTVKKEGYHVNIIKRGDLPEALQEFVVEPKKPRRVFI